VLTQAQKLQVLTQPHKFSVHGPLSKLPQTRAEDGGIIDTHVCLWMSNTNMKLQVYITEYVDFEWGRDGEQLVWEVDGLSLQPHEQNFKTYDTNVSLSYTMRVSEIGPSNNIAACM
jgi:hypothetical protein